MPDWKKEIRQRLTPLDLDPTREAGVVEELAGHAADYFAEQLREGAAEEEAVSRTLAQLSDTRLSENLLRSDTTPRPLFSRRFPFPVRVLAKHWRLTSVAVISLSVAIAAGAVGFSVFNALLLRPPTSAHPDRLVMVLRHAPSQQVQQVSYPEYRVYRDNNQVFSGLAAFQSGINMESLNYGNSTYRPVISTVSANYFTVLGVSPAVGRSFSGTDSAPQSEIVLSYPFWKRLGSPDVVGLTVRLRPVGQKESPSDIVTVVGVAPKSFSGTVAGFAIDIWAPIRLNLSPEALGNLERRDNRWLTMFGRLRPGITRQQAQAAVQVLGEQQAHDFPQTNKETEAKIAPFSMLPYQRDLAKMFSWAVLGVVALVLLAACANVINLLLGLATTRRQEMLIRAAIGATRRKLIWQLFKESFLLLAFSSVIGFLLADFGLEGLFTFRPTLFNGVPPILLDFRPDLRVLGLTGAMVILLTLGIGIMPALYASIPNLAEALNGEAAIGGTRKRRARTVLVVLQTAVCTLVLVAAGLCLRSIERLKQVPLGFTNRNLLFSFVAVSAETPATEAPIYSDLLRAVQGLPGINKVALASSIPLMQNGDPERVAPEGEETAKDRWSTTPYNFVTEDYFAALGLPLLAGRTFDSRDGEHAPQVVIISRAMAHKYWHNSDPLGKRIRIQSDNSVAQIIGVVEDTKYDDLGEAETPFLYLPLSQHPREVDDLALIVNTRGDPNQQFAALRSAVLKVDPTAFLFLDNTMEGQINFSLLIPRIILGCVAGFGLLALLLSMAGLYATTSYSVNERRKEIGIRIALGAQRRNLMTSLLRQAATFAGIGIGIGLAMGVALSALLGSLLYGIHPVEPVVLLLVTVFTTLLALLTAYFASKPWLAVDPLQAVRHM